MKYRFVLSLLCVLFIVNTAHAGSSDYRYALFDLGDFGGDASNAFGINDNGIVVGNAWFQGNSIYHMAAFTENKIWDLGTLGGDISFAYDINNHNIIAGVDFGEDRIYRPILWESGVFTDLCTLGGSNGFANSINDIGQIAGNTQIAGDYHSHAFRWHDGIMTDLDSLMGDEGSSNAWDINEVGQVVGYSAFVSIITAVLWQPDNEIIDLGGLCGSCFSKAYAINDLGITVGWAEIGNDVPVATLWDETGEIYNLQTGSGSEFYGSYARGINNQNQIVGYAGGIQRGFIYESGSGMRSLGDFVPPLLDMTVYTANDINEHGQIAGWGEMNGTGWYRAILLTPVEPELSLSDPSPGVAGQTNIWTISNATPFADITLAYSHKGGGAVIPGCDTLDAVIQMDRPQVIQTVTADADGVARFEIFVVNQASNFVDGILFQAASVGECEESQLKLFVFE